MGKRILAAVLTFMLFTGACCSAAAQKQTKETLNGLTIELNDAHYEKKGSLYVIPAVTILNKSGQDIMEVFFEMEFYDKSGKLLGTRGMFYLEDEPILNGDKARQNNSRYILDFNEKPAACSIHIKSYKTTKEMPPVHVPQEGEYLYQAMDNDHLRNLSENKPVKITVHIDQMGYGREANFTGENTLNEVVDAFIKMRVGSDDAPMVTDNYNWIRFEWEDGAKYMVRLNLKALEYEIYGRYHSYYLTGDEEFWGIVYSNLTEVQ